MALKIKTSDLLTSRCLIVQSDGVKFRETQFIGGRRHFRFHEILCVLLSADNQLSFQVAQEVFTIAVKPNDKKHQAVIAALLDGLRRAHGQEVETPA
jgi:hypothetical protein